MKKLFIILLFASQLFATDWYVQPITGEYGAEDGTSWANAFDGFADIAWGSIQPGDNIYLSDGTYAENLTVGASGSWDNYITIIAGKYSPAPTGHDGEVDINGVSGTGIVIESRHWIYVKGITVRNSSNRGINIYINSYRIVIDSCKIYDNYGMQITSDGNWPQNENLPDTTTYNHHIEIKNCFIQSRANYASANDCFFTQASGWLYIHHNIIHMRNTQTNPIYHIDPIQASNAVHSMYIYNNILITDSASNGHTLILGVFSRNSDYYDTMLVANNYIFNGGHTSLANYKQVLFWRGTEGSQPYHPVCFGLNNTIVTTNGGTICSSNESGAGGYLVHESNNIMIQYGQNLGVPSINNLDTWSNSATKYVDSCKTNLLWRGWGTGEVAIGWQGWVGSGGSPTGSPGDWATYSNASWGGTGVNDNPDFVRPYWEANEYDAYELQSSSPAIDAGTDLSYYQALFGYLPDFDITKDILGNPRDANWDIGCFEYDAGGWNPPDTTASISFTSVTNAELGSYHIGTGILSNADSTFWVLSSPDSFDINYPFVYDIQADTAHSGDTVKVPCVASGSYSTTVTKTIKVSGIDKTFSVTTKAAPSSGNEVVLRGSNGKLIYSNDGKVIYTR